MDKKQLHENLMAGIKKSLENLDTEKPVNEAVRFDKTNKTHKDAYNSFVKWYNRWNGKLEHMEMVALMKKIENDVRLLNISPINESRVSANAVADEHMAHDLFLTFENTESIYRLVQPMLNNLLRRLRNGQELSQEILATSSVAEKYAKATIEEYRRMNGRIIVDAVTRKALKQKIAKWLIDTAQDDFAFEQHDMESNLHD